MLPIVLRLGKYLGILFLLIFICAFTWANWRPLSPGERAKPVIFGQIDAEPIGDTTKAKAITKAINEIPGVNVAVVNFESQIIAVGFSVYDVSFEDIKKEIKSQFNYTLTPKKIKTTGRVCPMGKSLSFSKRVRLMLCVRGQ